MIIDLVKYPVITEKSVQLKDKKQYTFDVNLKLNKVQIKALIQDLFQINVLSVNTHRLPRKKKNLGASKGYQSRYKRVIITVNNKDSILVTGKLEFQKNFKEDKPKES